MRSMRIRRRLAAMLLASAAVLIGMICSFALSPSSTPVMRGIDVSEWQGGIDFESVRKSGIEVVYIRACYGGNYTDPYFRRNASDAFKAGLKFGCYHYITATNVEQARQQARYFAKVIRSEPYTCRPAMDFESFGSLSSAQINAIATAYLTELKAATGVIPAIYSDANAAANTFDASLAVYPLWVADWGADEPADNGKWKYWSGFQYSDTGRVDGINTAVDLDYLTNEMLLSLPSGSSSNAASGTSSMTSAITSSSDSSVISSEISSSSGGSVSQTSSATASSSPVSSGNTSGGTVTSITSSDSSAPVSSVSSATSSSPDSGIPIGGWLPIIVVILIYLVLLIFVLISPSHWNRKNRR